MKGHAMPWFESLHVVTSAGSNLHALLRAAAAWC